MGPKKWITETKVLWLVLPSPPQPHTRAWGMVAADRDGRGGDFGTWWIFTVCQGICALSVSLHPAGHQGQDLSRQLTLLHWAPHLRVSLNVLQNDDDSIGLISKTHFKLSYKLSLQLCEFLSNFSNIKTKFSIYYYHPKDHNPSLAVKVGKWI